MEVLRHGERDALRTLTLFKAMRPLPWLRYIRSKPVQRLPVEQAQAFTESLGVTQQPTAQCVVPYIPAA
eukprot:scaffold161972_cov20-Prasinocladus_malaysianus.AAC.1